MTGAVARRTVSSQMLWASARCAVAWNLNPSSVEVGRELRPAEAIRAARSADTTVSSRQVDCREAERIRPNLMLRTVPLVVLFVRGRVPCMTLQPGYP